MSGSEETGEVEEDGGLGYEEPYVDEEEPAATPRLRRRPFGFKASDVRAELRARKAECDEMREDVAALWLVFNQQERALRELSAAVARLGGDRIAQPRERRDEGPAIGKGNGAAPAAPPRPPVPSPALRGAPEPPVPRYAAPQSQSAPRPAPPASAPPAAPESWVAEQLEGLDDVLSAIRQATEMLERTYDEEIAPDSREG